MDDFSRVSLSFFNSLFLKTIRNEDNKQRIVQADLNRLHVFAKTVTGYSEAVAETEVLLNMFVVP